MHPVVSLNWYKVALLISVWHSGGRSCTGWRSHLVQLLPKLGSTTRGRLVSRSPRMGEVPYARPSLDHCRTAPKSAALSFPVRRDVDVVLCVRRP